METGMIRLAGMKGPQCAENIVQAISSLDGVSSVKISFETSKASVLFDEGLVSIDELKLAVERAGYQIAKPVHGEDGACCGGCGG